MSEQSWVREGSLMGGAGSVVGTICTEKKKTLHFNAVGFFTEVECPAEQTGRQLRGMQLVFVSSCDSVKILLT